MKKHANSWVSKFDTWAKWTVCDGCLLLMTLIRVSTIVNRLDTGFKRSESLRYESQRIWMEVLFGGHCPADGDSFRFTILSDLPVLSSWPRGRDNEWGTVQLVAWKGDTFKTWPPNSGELSSVSLNGHGSRPNFFLYSYLLSMSTRADRQKWIKPLSFCVACVYVWNGAVFKYESLCRLSHLDVPIVRAKGHRSSPLSILSCTSPLTTGLGGEGHCECFGTLPTACAQELKYIDT